MLWSVYCLVYSIQPYVMYIKCLYINKYPRDSFAHTQMLSDTHSHKPRKSARPRNRSSICRNIIICIWGAWAWCAPALASAHQPCMMHESHMNWVSSWSVVVVRLLLLGYCNAVPIVTLWFGLLFLLLSLWKVVHQQKSVPNWIMMVAYRFNRATTTTTTTKQTNIKSSSVHDTLCGFVWPRSSNKIRRQHLMIGVCALFYHSPSI